MSVNKAILLGYLGKDPETKTFQDGGQITNFSLATSERAYTTKQGQQIPERTQWHNIQVSGKMSEVAAKYLKKGSKLYLEGVIRYRKYTDSNNIERYITEVHATMFDMLAPKSEVGITPPENRVSNENPFSISEDDDDLPF